MLLVAELTEAFFGSNEPAWVPTESAEPVWREVVAMVRKRGAEEVKINLLLVIVITYQWRLLGE